MKMLVFPSVTSITLLLLFSCTNNQKYQNKQSDIPAVQKKIKDITLRPVQAATNRNYNQFLTSMIDKLRKNISLSKEEIKNCIPLTQDEYLAFYKLANSKTQEYFNQINQLIFNVAKERYEDSFFLYLNMSEFVDGEFAETYFDDLIYMIDQEHSHFCSAYPKLSKVAQEKFVEQKDEHCNK